jgi:hypothetical protein
MPVPATTTPTSSTIPLHRIRFYDQTPSPITCLAYPPSPLPLARDPSHKGKAKAPIATTDELGVLVVARENGDVEVHQWARENERSYGNWNCVKVSRVKSSACYSSMLIIGTATYIDSSECISHGTCHQGSGGFSYQGVQCT